MWGDLPNQGQLSWDSTSYHKRRKQWSSKKHLFLLLQGTNYNRRLTQAVAKKDWLSRTARYPGWTGESFLAIWQNATEVTVQLGWTVGPNSWTSRKLLVRINAHRFEDTSHLYFGSWEFAPKISENTSKPWRGPLCRWMWQPPVLCKCWVWQTLLNVGDPLVFEPIWQINELR